MRCGALVATLQSLGAWRAVVATVRSRLRLHNWPPKKGGATYRASPSGAAYVVQSNVLLARLIYYNVGDFVHVYVPITLT